MDTNIKILLIEKDDARAGIFFKGLHASELTRIEWLKDTKNLHERVLALDPHILLIDLANPKHHELEHIFQISHKIKRPIALFVDQTDSLSTRKAIDAGISAYIVDGLKSERLPSIIDMALSRFNNLASLQKELAKAQSALMERNAIDKAKQLLMKQRTLGESEAYALMRKTAMNKSLKISDIATSILTASEIMGK